MEHNIEVISSRIGGGIHVYATHGSFQKPSVADADEIEPGEWYISRVMIVESFRGQGLGSKLLNAIIDACRDRGAKLIKVTPGGYGSDPKQLEKFYVKAGFETTSQPGLLIFNMKNEH